MSIYRTIGGAIKKVDRIEDGCWIHAINPDNEEKKLLIRDLGINPMHIRDALDGDQRASVTRTRDYLFIVVHCPSSDTPEPISVAPVPLGIMLTRRAIVTLCLYEPDVIRGMMQDWTCQVATDEGIVFVLDLIMRNTGIFREHLRQIHEQSTLKEEELKSSVTGERLIEIMNDERSLIFFVSSLHSNQKMLNRLLQSDILSQSPRERELLEEVVEESDECTEVAEAFLRIHSSLIDGFSSLVSLNLNLLVRTLTEITIALSIPAIIVGLWGMNVALPLVGHPLAYWIIIILLVMLAAVTILVLRLGLRIPPRNRR